MPIYTRFLAEFSPNKPYLVGREGVEPSRCHHRRILSPQRLPIPPPPQLANYTTFLRRLACRENKCTQGDDEGPLILQFIMTARNSLEFEKGEDPSGPRRFRILDPAVPAR